MNDLAAHLNSLLEQVEALIDCKHPLKDLVSTLAGSAKWCPHCGGFPRPSDSVIEPARVSSIRQAFGLLRGRLADRENARLDRGRSVWSYHHIARARSAAEGTDAPIGIARAAEPDPGYVRAFQDAWTLRLVEALRVAREEPLPEGHVLRPMHLLIEALAEVVLHDLEAP